MLQFSCRFACITLASLKLYTKNNTCIFLLEIVGARLRVLNIMSLGAF